MRAKAVAALLALWPCLPATAQTITEAAFSEPTLAYPHGVLGDELEWGSLDITLSRRRGDETTLFSGHLDLTYRIAALPGTVFEDIAPRLWDIDGDGAPEVVVVESHQSRGARLLIVGLNDGELQYLAATPHIGTRFRWLAPVGATDLDGDGYVEIAYVDRPHLAKTLRIWRYRDGALSEITALPGLTNHRIGEDFISGGLRTCGDTPEMILVNGNWTRIISVSYQNGWIKTDLGPFEGLDSLSAALNC